MFCIVPWRIIFRLQVDIHNGADFSRESELSMHVEWFKATAGAEQTVGGQHSLEFRVEGAIARDAGQMAHQRTNCHVGPSDIVDAVGRIARQGSQFWHKFGDALRQCGVTCGPQIDVSRPYRIQLRQTADMQRDIVIQVYSACAIGEAGGCVVKENSGAASSS